VKQPSTPENKGFRTFLLDNFCFHDL